MYEYRISKYDIKKRKNDVFLGNEWTDFSDIGKSFDGKELTLEEYLQVERNYVSCIINIICETKNLTVSISCYEDYGVNSWTQGMQVDIDTLPSLIIDCLRNKCWCKLEAKKFFLHFGWDYYVYIGCDLKYSQIGRIATQNALFCEEYESPYK